MTALHFGIGALALLVILCFIQIGFLEARINGLESDQQKVTECISGLTKTLEGHEHILEIHTGLLEKRMGVKR